MNNLIQALKGRKTYILALAAILYALLGIYLGKIGSAEALDMVWTALTAAAIRNGIQPPFIISPPVFTPSVQTIPLVAQTETLPVPPVAPTV